MAETAQIVTRLVVDASGAKTGMADFQAAMAKGNVAVNENSAALSSFDKAQRMWNASLAAADPVMRAHINLQNAMARQTAIGTEAVKLGIATQTDHLAALDRVQAKYQAYVNRAEESTKATSGFDSALGFVTEGLATFGLVLGVEKIVEWGKEAIEAAKNAQDLGEALNTSGGFVLAFETAATRLGLSSEGADKALQKLNQSVGGAITGNDAAIKAFRDLGISVDDLTDGHGSMRPLSQIVGMVADGLKHLEGSGRDGADAVELFGRSGQRLLPVLRDGAAALNDNAAASNRNVVAAAALGEGFESLGVKAKGAAIDVIGWTARLFGFGNAADVLPEKIARLEREITVLERKRAATTGYPGSQATEPCSSRSIRTSTSSISCKQS